ncbi:MAG: hypothetical protein KAS32_17730 [Candidatus Peribacteraceae bacterium]|nr:hypothetical protein [Candidatus Peribacteraceae bacterium]
MDKNSIFYQETRYGFDYGDAKVTRLFSDSKKGWVTIGIESSKCIRGKGREVQIYVTKTGKIRIHDSRGEWTPPQKQEPTT